MNIRTTRVDRKDEWPGPGEIFLTIRRYSAYDFDGSKRRKSCQQLCFQICAALADHLGGAHCLAVSEMGA